MPTFEQLTTPVARKGADGQFVHEIHDGWQQGRGAFGGLVLASLVRAVEAFAGRPGLTLRTLTAELCGPVLPGEAEIRVEPLRVGSGTSTVAARMVQQDEVLAHAVIVLGRARDPEPRYAGLPRPAITPFREVMPLPAEATTASFAQHFEYRNTGPIPFSRSAEATAAGWVRPRDPGTARDGAFLVGVADAWWPAVLSIMSAPRPAATITFTIDIVGQCAGLDPEAPFYHDAHTLSASDGWAPEVRTLWGEDGRLLAINHQTFVVIK